MLKTIVIGHLGKDATTNDVNGRTVINFSVAHSEVWKDKVTGEKKTNTTWLNCSYWTDRTAIVPYLKKGTLVCVEGKPSVRSYTANGQAAASLELQVSNVQLLGGSNQDQQTAQPNSQQRPDAPPPPWKETQHPQGFQPVNNGNIGDADDLPF